MSASRDELKRLLEEKDKALAARPDVVKALRQYGADIAEYRRQRTGSEGHRGSPARRSMTRSPMGRYSTGGT
jgi:hypothetical protein